MELSDRLGAFVINKKAMANIGNLSEEELYLAASRNASRLFKPVCYKMLPVNPRIIYSMMVLTNESNFNGASALIYAPDEIIAYANKVKKDIIIIPSSIHECLLLPYDNIDIEAINRDITRINKEEVHPGEQLSDHCYIYSRRVGQIMTDTEYLKLIN